MFPTVAAVVALILPAVPQLLTIGSPAPKFDAATFLTGEPFTELARGTMYVVEFSGTQCAPCVKAMPVLTALQKKHSDVVFVSMYGEKEGDVREAIAKHQDKIGFRVALDSNGTMARTWVEAAGRGGIPDAYVVDKTGIVAWIGNPLGMAGPLEQILAGTFDPTRDALQIRYYRAGRNALGRMGTRNDAVGNLHERIKQFLNEGRAVDAAPLIEQALRDFPDYPVFRELQVSMWAMNAETETRAIHAAIDRAAELRFLQTQEWRSFEVEGYCNALMDAAEKTKSTRLLVAAEVLATKELELIDRFGVPAERTLREHRWRNVLAALYRRTKNLDRLAEQLRHLIRLEKQTQVNLGYRQTLEEFEANRREQIARLEAELAEVERPAPPGK